MNIGLRTKFLVPALGLIIAGGIISAIVFYSTSIEMIERIVTDQVGVIAESASKQTDLWIGDRKKEMVGLGGQRLFQIAVHDSFMAESARKKADLLLKETAQRLDFYKIIILADASGKPVAVSDPDTPGEMLTKYSRFLKPPENGETVSVSGLIKTGPKETPLLAISTSVRENEKTVGRLAGFVDMDYASAYFAENVLNLIRVGKQGYTYVTDPEGLAIFHPDKTEPVTFDLKEYDYGRTMLEQKTGITHFKLRGNEKIAAFNGGNELKWLVVVTADKDELCQPAMTILTDNLIVVLGLIAVGVVVIALVVRSIVNPINDIIRGLHDISDGIAATAGQVLSSGHELSKGAADQATAIGDTSSSLEEMSAMTGQTAEHSQAANKLMRNASQVVGQANDSMANLNVSMEEISRASEETSKIIKTIDEIAFQTNLLALNAAVEAARAGDAGAGFAVVAEEVRNLALRSAEAARNTTGMLEDTVKKIKNGTAMVGMTNEEFNQVAEHTAKAVAIVDQIASASAEQARGIENMNRAVVEVDKVTLRNTSISQESVTASEEMNIRAAELKRFVNALIELTKGDAGDREHARAGKKRIPASPEKKAAKTRALQWDEDDLGEF